MGLSIGTERAWLDMRIPFQFHIKLPPTLKTGIDYGFLPGRDVSKKGETSMAPYL